jgi:hypothetical protein
MSTLQTKKSAEQIAKYADMFSAMGTSPETPIAPKSVHLRFVGSLEEGHFCASLRLRLMCRKPA